MVNIWSEFFHLLGGRCPLCHTAADGLCGRCSAALPVNRCACPVCALPLPVDAGPATLCADCQRQPPAFDAARIPLLYEPPVDDLVAGLKYHGRLAHARLLAQAWLAHQTESPDDRRPDLLLPVPMDPRGLRERGFNQAAELARHLAAAHSIPWSGGHLLRTRHTDHQRGLGRRARLRNLRDAFACRGALPAHVALVDDVLTTGATADALARQLKRAGVARVEVWAVARTPPAGGKARARGALSDRR